ncbi:MAG: diaminopimelate dehydrogenase [Akkermansia sp.]
MIKVAIIGYGNIGKYSIDAVKAAPDMELVGIVRRAGSEPVHGVKTVNDIATLGQIDVALLCTPTRSVEKTALPLLVQGINTVDSFDIHEGTVALRRSLGAQAKQGNAVSIISAGWDPGTDSIMRTLLLAMAPQGITYTNFGPGMSMGHSVVARSKEGVKDALSLTIPTGSGIHRRMVYVVLNEGVAFSDVERAIKEDSYFCHDDTKVQQVPDIESLRDMGHGVLMERKGVSGLTQNQLFKFEMRINNPALTAQVMVSAARATTRLTPGCYTLPEVAPIDFLPGDDREKWVAKLV